MVVLFVLFMVGGGFVCGWWCFLVCLWLVVQLVLFGGGGFVGFILWLVVLLVLFIVGGGVGFVCGW